MIVVVLGAIATMKCNAQRGIIYEQDRAVLVEFDNVRKAGNGIEIDNVKPLATINANNTFGIAKKDENDPNGNEIPEGCGTAQKGFRRFCGPKKELAQHESGYRLVQCGNTDNTICLDINAKLPKL